MRFSTILALVFASFAGFFLTAARGEDPAEKFLRVHLLLEESSQLQSQGLIIEAHGKCYDAWQTLVAIHRDHPQWQPLVVRYRLSQTEKELEALTVKARAIRDQNGPSPEQGAGSSPSAENRPQARISAARAGGEEVASRRGAALSPEVVELERKLREALQEKAIAEEKFVQIQKKLVASDAELRSSQKSLAQLEELRAAVREDDLQEKNLKKMEKESQRLKVQVARSKKSSQKWRKQSKELKKSLEKAHGELRDFEMAQAQWNEERDQWEEWRRLYGPEVVATLEKRNRELQSEVEKRDASLAENDVLALEEENEILKQIVRRQMQWRSEKQRAVELLAEQFSAEQMPAPLLRDEISVALRGGELFITPEEEAIGEKVIQSMEDGAWSFHLSAPAREMGGEGEKQDASVAEVPSSKKAQRSASEKPPEIVKEDVESESISRLEKEEMAPPSEVNEDRTPPPANPFSLDSLPPETLEQAKSARKSLLRGDLAKAREHYAQILEKSPDHPLALCGLAVVAMREEKWDDALQQLNRAKQVAKNWGHPHHLTGLIYYQRGMFAEAFSAFQQSSAREEQNAKSFFYLGICADRLGRINEAIEAMDRSIELEPKNGVAHYNLAALLVKVEKGSARRAQRHYQRALELGVAPDAQLEKLLSAEQ